MTSPADTIREALEATISTVPGWTGTDPWYQARVENALAALTELEQQLADLTGASQDHFEALTKQSEEQADEARKWRDRAEAAEADLHRLQEELSRHQGIAAEAEADRDRLVEERDALLRDWDAEQRENKRLADTLREMYARLLTRRTGIHADGTHQYASPILGELAELARAALDRQETTNA